MANDVGSGTPSPNTKDYVLVTRVDPDSGVKYQEQVLKSEFENSEEYKGLSTKSDDVREANPPENRPTSDLTEEEAKRLGRKV